MGLRMCEFMGMRKGIEVRLGPGDRERLATVIGSGNSPQKHVWRARIVLMTGDGIGTNTIMRQTGKSKVTVWRWQERFMTQGVDGLVRDKTRPSRIPRLPATVQEQTVALTQTDPPAHAVVLSVDEKSQIQALDRTQPGLPMKKGRCATMTHDYKRHGTTTLFAALNVLEGKIIGRCMQRHRHQEFIRFLNAIEAEVPAGKIVHVIVDNYATHKHPKVKGWLTRHPRFVFHFTPTSCSWLNAVEGFFAKLTRRRLKRGVFRSLVELQAAINRFIAETNHAPKPFIWTADPDKIIAAVDRGRQALASRALG